MAVGRRIKIPNLHKALLVGCNFMTLLLTIVIAVMQALIVIIPLKGKLSDNRYKFPRNFTKRGYLLISCCIVTMIATISVFFITEREERVNKTILTQQLKERDSIHQQKIVEAGRQYIEELDKSNKNTVEALAKYGLHYDSLQNKVVRLIRDSSRTDIPYLEVCGYSFQDFYRNNDSIKFPIALCNNQGTVASKIHANFKLLFQKGTDIANLYNENVFPNFVNIPAHSNKSKTFTFKHRVLPTIDKIFLLVRGKCSNQKGTATSEIYSFVIMDFAAKRYREYDFTNDSLLYAYMIRNKFTR